MGLNTRISDSNSVPGGFRNEAPGARERKGNEKNTNMIDEEKVTAQMVKQRVESHLLKELPVTHEFLKGMIRVYTLRKSG